MAGGIGPAPLKFPLPVPTISRNLRRFQT